VSTTHIPRATRRVPLVEQELPTQVKHNYFRGTDCHNLRWIRGRTNALALNSNDTLQHVRQETLHTGDHSMQTQTIEIRPTNLPES
jgi:hypothetical protein